MPATTSLNINAPRSGPQFLADVKDHVEHLHLRAPFRAVNTGGTSTALTASVTPTFTALVTSQRFLLKFTTTPASGATLNINALGAKKLARPDGVDIVKGDILPGWREVVYDGAKFLAVALDRIPTLLGYGSYQATISTTTAAAGATGTAASFGGVGSGTWMLMSKKSLSALGKSTTYLCMLVRIR